MELSVWTGRPRPRRRREAPAGKHDHYIADGKLGGLDIYAFAVLFYKSPVGG
jgi:hypothetical protein